MMLHANTDPHSAFYTCVGVTVASIWTVFIPAVNPLYVDFFFAREYVEMYQPMYLSVAHKR
jgi:hypothetical protein